MRGSHVYTDLREATEQRVIEPTAARPRLKWVDAAFYLCIALNLLPILLFKHLPFADGPVLLQTAQFLRDWLSGDSAYFTWLIEFNPTLVPNWFVHVILTFFMSVMDAFTAERLLVAIYIVTLPLAFRQLLRDVKQDTAGWEFLIFPFIFSSHLHGAFYNFCFSLVFYLVLLRYWLRWRHAMTLRRSAGLAVFGLLLYFTHPVSLIESIVALGTLGFWEFVLYRRVSVIRNMAWTAVAFVPALALWGWFLSHRVYAGATPQQWTRVQWTTTTFTGSNLLKLSPLKSFFDSELVFTIALSAFFACMGIVMTVRFVRDRMPWTNAGFGILAVIQAAIVLLAPINASGGGMITARLIYYPAFSLVLWLATAKWSGVSRAAFAAFGLLIASALQILHLPAYRAYAERMDIIAGAVPPLDAGKTIAFFTTGSIFPFDVSRTTSNYSRTAVGRIADRDRLIYLNNYTLATDHYPFMLRAATDPYTHLLGEDDETMDPERYYAQTGKTVDYVLLWGWDSKTDDKALNRILGISPPGKPYEEVPLQNRGLPLRLLRRPENPGA